MDSSKVYISKSNYLLSGQLLEFICAYLLAKEILHLSFANRYYYESITSDEKIWKNIVYVELSFTEIHQLPKDSLDISVISSVCVSSNEGEITTYYTMYKKWREYFYEYKACDIKLAIVWWTRMENYLLKHAPFIHKTLNPPASRQLIAQFEALMTLKLQDNSDRDSDSNSSSNDTPTIHLPHYLKLLYMFHNGQSLLIDKIQELGVSGYREYLGKHHLSENDINQSICNGLFGSYDFYDQFTCLRFLPLQKSLTYSEVSSSSSSSPSSVVSRLVRRPHNHVTTASAESRVTSHEVDYQFYDEPMTPLPCHPPAAADTSSYSSSSSPLHLFAFITDAFNVTQPAKNLYCVDTSPPPIPSSPRCHDQDHLHSRQRLESTKGHYDHFCDEVLVTSGTSLNYLTS